MLNITYIIITAKVLQTGELDQDYEKDTLAHACGHFIHDVSVLTPSSGKIHIEKQHQYYILYI